MTFLKDNGGQHAPLQMIYNMKQENLRHKARLVVDEHVLNPSDFTMYSSTIKDLLVRLLMTVAVQNNLGFMVGNAGTAFCTAQDNQKEWSIAGPEFLD